MKAFIIIFAISIVNTYTQDKKPFNKPIRDTTHLVYGKHNLGVAAGSIIGSGFSYRRWYASGSGYQLTLAPFVKFSDDESQGLFNFGLTGFNSFYTHSDFKFLNSKTTRSNGFIYYGANYLGTYDENIYRDEKDSSSIEYDEIHEHSVSGGGGLGFEIYIWKVNLSFMVGFKVVGKIEKLVEFSLTEPEETKKLIQTMPSAEFSLHIPIGRFKR